VTKNSKKKRKKRFLHLWGGERKERRESREFGLCLRKKKENSAWMHHYTACVAIT